jgi:hypothetical protein
VNGEGCSLCTASKTSSGASDSVAGTQEMPWSDGRKIKGRARVNLVYLKRNYQHPSFGCGQAEVGAEVSLSVRRERLLTGDGA